MKYEGTDLPAMGKGVDAFWAAAVTIMDTLPHSNADSKRVFYVENYDQHRASYGLILAQYTIGAILSTSVSSCGDSHRFEPSLDGHCHRAE